MYDFSFLIYFVSASFVIISLSIYIALHFVIWDGRNSWIFICFFLILIGFTIAIILPGFAVNREYLGQQPYDSNSDDWYKVHLNNSVCSDKVLLGVHNCCANHISVYCKKFFYPIYIWSEDEAFVDNMYIKWWWQ